MPAKYSIMYIYSGANKYLIHCRFFKFFNLQRMERDVIFIVGTPQLSETEYKRNPENHIV